MDQKDILAALDPVDTSPLIDPSPLDQIPLDKEGIQAILNRYVDEIIRRVENATKPSSESEDPEGTLDDGIKPSSFNTQEVQELLLMKLQRSTATYLLVLGQILPIAIKIQLYQQLRNLLDSNAKDQLTILLHTHTANTDPLTGIKNRRAIQAFYESLTPRTEDKGLSFGIIRVDMDDFGSFNKAPYSPHIGDKLLQLQAKAFSRAIRHPSQSIGRFGGDEFIIVLSEIPVSDQQNIIENIFIVANEKFKSLVLADIELSAVIPEDKIPTFSAGAAFHTDTEKLPFSTLDASAIEKLHKAKMTGKNQIA